MSGPLGGFFWLTMYISSFFWTTCVIVQPVDSTSHLLWLSEFHQWQDWQQCWLWYKRSTVNVTSHSWQPRNRQYSDWDRPRQAVIRRTGTDEYEHDSWHLGMVCTHLTVTQTDTQTHTYRHTHRDTHGPRLSIIDIDTRAINSQLLTTARWVVHSLNDCPCCTVWILWFTGYIINCSLLSMPTNTTHSLCGLHSAINHSIITDKQQTSRIWRS